LAGTPGVAPVEGNVAVDDATGGETAGGAFVLAVLELLLFHHEVLVELGAPEASVEPADLQPATANKLNATAAMRAVEVRMAANPWFCPEKWRRASLQSPSPLP
jgi:hypothetical protein